MLPSRARGLLAGLSSRFQTGFEPELVFLGFRQELVSWASNVSSFPGLPTRAQFRANICGEVLQHLGLCFLVCMWALGPSCHYSHVRLVQGCARRPFVLPTCHFATAPHSRACHAPMGECGVVFGSAPMPAPRAPPFGPSLATKLRFAQPGAQASLLGGSARLPCKCECRAGNVAVTLWAMEKVSRAGEPVTDRIGASVGSSSATSLPACVLRALCHLHALSGRRTISSWPLVTVSPACTPRTTRRARALRLSRHPCTRGLPPRARSSHRARDLRGQLSPRLGHFFFPAAGAGKPQLSPRLCHFFFPAACAGKPQHSPRLCHFFFPAACAGKPQLSPRLCHFFFSPRARRETPTFPAA
jgi:hypothetical protein